MKESKDIVRPTLDPHTAYLLTMFRQAMPRTFEHDSHYENEWMREIHFKKSLCLIMALVVVGIFGFSTKTEAWSWFSWLYLITCAGILIASYLMISYNFALLELRRNVTRSWTLDAVQSGLPVVAKPLRQSGDYETNYKKLKDEGSIIASILQVKAEELALNQPLSQFGESMERFIRTNEELKRRLHECYALAETLNPDTQVHF